MLRLIRHPLARLRTAGIAEGITLVTLLFIAVPMKYLAGMPQLVSILGPVHGIVFVVYIVTLVENFSGGGWAVKDMVRTSIAAVIPFGTFYNDRWLSHRAEMQV